MSQDDTSQNVKPVYPTYSDLSRMFPLTTLMGDRDIEARLWDTPRFEGTGTTSGFYSVADHTVHISDIVDWKPHAEAMRRDQLEFDSLCELEENLLPAQSKVLDQIKAWIDAAHFAAAFEAASGTGESKTWPWFGGLHAYRASMEAFAKHDSEQVRMALVGSHPTTIHSTLYGKTPHTVCLDIESDSLQSWSDRLDPIVLIDESAFGGDTLQDWHPTDFAAFARNCHISSPPGLGKTHVMKQLMAAATIAVKPSALSEPQINNRASRRRAGRPERKKTYGT
jgi:hypothetical protein